MGLGLAEPGFATACYCEIEEYPRKTLIAAQRAGYLHPAPIWDDLKLFNARPWRGQIDTLLAGYPCQPFSQAGQRKGEDDPRHLFPDIDRIIEELGDGLRWLFFENVQGHITLGLETVVRRLQQMGFRVAVGLFSAEETGTTHERQRIFIVAYRERGSRERRRDPSQLAGAAGDPESVSKERKRHGHAAHDGGADVADAHGWNTRTERQQRGGKQRLHPEGRGIGAGDVGDASQLGRREGRAEHGLRRGRNTVAGAGRELAHCHDTGPQGQRGNFDCPKGRQEPARHARLRSGAGLHPPGPADMDIWRDVLVVHPDGAPALSFGDLSTFSRYFAALVEAGELSETEAESRLCRMADGMAARSRALRLLGNGVHPLAAAYAWRSLSAAHGLSRVDLGAEGSHETTEAARAALTQSERPHAMETPRFFVSHRQRDNAAATAIAAERQRQIEVEGWTPEHDDEHQDGELLTAAIIYLWWGTDRAAPLKADGTPMGWPWDPEWWKPKDRCSNLIRAGALCQAEQDRLVRAGKTSSHAHHKYRIALRELSDLYP